MAVAVSACATTDVDTPLAAPPPIDRPIFTAGDRWVFAGRSGARREIVYQGRRNDALVFRLTGAPPAGSRRPTTVEELRSIDLARITGTAQFTGAAIEYRPDDGALRFPLAVGNSWRHSYVRVIRRAVPPVPPEEEMIVEATVKAYEHITVPGGSFAAFRIESTTKSVGDTAPPLSATYWYAPAAKVVIKYQAETRGLRIEGDALSEYELKP
jgi:hypothetical protein